LGIVFVLIAEVNAVNYIISEGAIAMVIFLAGKKE